MDNWDATIFRQLSARRHAEDLARGHAARRAEAGLAGRVPTLPHRAARRVALALSAAVSQLRAAREFPAREPWTPYWWSARPCRPPLAGPGRATIPARRAW